MLSRGLHTSRLFLSIIAVDKVVRWNEVCQVGTVAHRRLGTVNNSNKIYIACVDICCAKCHPRDNLGQETIPISLMTLSPRSHNIITKYENRNDSTFVLGANPWNSCWIHLLSSIYPCHYLIKANEHIWDKGLQSRTVLGNLLHI